MRLTGRFAASNARRGWPEYRWVRDRTAVPTRSISEAPKTPFRPSPFQTSSRRPTAAGRDRPRRVLHSRHPPTFQRPDRDEYRLRKEPATCRPRAHQGWRRRQARTRSPTRGRYLLWPTWPGAVEPFAWPTRPASPHSRRPRRRPPGPGHASCPAGSAPAIRFIDLEQAALGNGYTELAYLRTGFSAGLGPPQTGSAPAAAGPPAACSRARAVA